MNREIIISVVFISPSLAGLVGCSGGTSVTGSSNPTTPDTEVDASQAGGDDGGCSVFAGALDDAAIAEGAELVQVAQCASCHQGDAGTLGGGTYTMNGAVAYPPNLTPDQATGLGCWTDSQIAGAMMNGVDNEGVNLCVMPRFSFDAGSAQAVISYLRSLPPVSNQVPDTNCP